MEREAWRRERERKKKSAKAMIRSKKGGKPGEGYRKFCQVICLCD